MNARTAVRDNHLRSRSCLVIASVDNVCSKWDKVGLEVEGGKIFYAIWCMDVIILPTVAGKRGGYPGKESRDGQLVVVN
ncbi:hypothetical protein ACHAXS_003204 [Conticribra weissflogii]